MAWGLAGAGGVAIWAEATASAVGVCVQAMVWAWREGVCAQVWEPALLVVEASSHQGVAGGGQEEGASWEAAAPGAAEAVPAGG